MCELNWSWSCPPYLIDNFWLVKFEVIILSPPLGNASPGGIEDA
jgi:hypothetical protein